MARQSATFLDPHDDCFGHLEERIMMSYFELRTTNSSIASNMMIIDTYRKRMTRRLRLQVFLDCLDGSQFRRPRYLEKRWFPQ